MKKTLLKTVLIIISIFLALSTLICCLGGYIPFSKFIVANKIEDYILSEYGIKESIKCSYHWYNSNGDYIVKNSEYYEYDWDITYNIKSDSLYDQRLNNKTHNMAAADIGKMWQNQIYNTQKINSSIRTTVDCNGYQKKQKFSMHIKNLSDLTEQEGLGFALDNIHKAIGILTNEKYHIKTITYIIEDKHKKYVLETEFENVANLPKEQLHQYISVIPID